MADAAQKRATYQDVLDAPPNMVAEILDGELHLQPRPAMLHAFAGSGIGFDLGNPFQRGRRGPGGWWIIDEPELHLGPDVVVPDLAGWRQERMPTYPRAAFVELPPDWACEILSPATRRRDLLLKARIYARAGVTWLWFVDPEPRLIEVRRLHEGQWLVEVTVDATEGPTRIPPFDAIEVDPGDWFPPTERVFP